MNEWVRCPFCGHKLFWKFAGTFSIEIKCPSCKKIILMEQEDQGNEQAEVSR